MRDTVSPLNTDTVTEGTIIGQPKIVQLPLNGRQFIQLALLVPGASGGGRAVQQNAVRQGQVGGISIAGGRTNNTVFLLDGQPMSIPTTARSTIHRRSTQSPNFRYRRLPSAPNTAAPP